MPEANVELLARANIKHDGDPAELLAKANIRPTEAELLAKFRLSTDDWVPQGISVEAYIALGIVT